jgi:hypothetical protein
VSLGWPQANYFYVGLKRSLMHHSKDPVFTACEQDTEPVKNNTDQYLKLLWVRIQPHYHKTAISNKTLAKRSHCITHYVIYHSSAAVCVCVCVRGRWNSCVLRPPPFHTGHQHHISDPPYTHKHCIYTHTVTQPPDPPVLAPASDPYVSQLVCLCDSTNSWLG